MRGTAAHSRNESVYQRYIAMHTDLADTPQAGTDHRQGHPHDTLLSLGADLVDLHLPQVMRLLDEIVLHRLRLAANVHQPTRDPALGSSEPKATTIACSGQSWAMRVTTRLNVSADIRRR